tara:strand:- start:264 stop:1739 length:1476 start_codon:yes stop_codon:yes gene_type:complete
MTQNHLYCIFNANDPTPTALAIKSMEFDYATVFVVNESKFSQKQKDSLIRLEQWLRGSAKNNEWPEGWWNSRWNWTPVNTKVNFVSVSSIDGTIFEGNEDHKPIIDLKGGTKRNSIEMMDAGREVFTEPEFILSGMGESILLSRGLILPRALLSLKELVWLTSGFVIDPMIIPNHNMKQTVKDNFSFKEIQRNGVKRARFDDEFLKRIGKKVPDNEFHRKMMHEAYLEEFTVSMLNLSPLVGECVGGVRFIDPNFEVTLGTLRSTMSKENIRRKLEDSNTIDALLQEANGATTAPKKKAITFIQRYLHTMEIDALAALPSGELLGIECKYGRYTSDDVYRIRAICHRVSPRCTPVLIHSELDNSNLFEVPEISFINLPHSPVETIFKLKNMTPLKSGLGDLETRNQNLRNPFDSFPILKEAIEDQMDSPLSWVEFCTVIESLGVEQKSLDKALDKLGKKMKFTLNKKSEEACISWKIDETTKSETGKEHLA